MLKCCYINEGNNMSENIFNNVVNLSATEIKKFIEVNAGDVHYRNKSNATLLHLAAEFDSNVKVAEVLISMGADINTKEDSGFTPFHLAVSYGSVGIAKLLISNGADVNAAFNDVITPLHMAIISDNADSDKKIEIVKLLISEGADLNAKTPAGDTPYDAAKKKGDVGIMLCLLNRDTNENIEKYFLEAIPNINFQTKNGWTILHRVTYEGYLNLVLVLISMGADLNIKEENGLIPIDMAIGRGHIDIINVFLSHISDINARGPNNLTLLHRAACSKDFAGDKSVEIAKFLVSKGADIRAIANNRTPLDIAKEIGDTLLVEYFLSCMSSEEREQFNEKDKKEKEERARLEAEKRKKQEEQEKKDQEERECREAEERERKRRDAEKQAVLYKAERKKRIIGTILQLALSVGFIFLIFNPEIIRPQFTEYLNSIENTWKLLFMTVLPFGIASIIMGMISLIVIRKCESFFGLLFIVIINIVYAIGITLFSTSGFEIGKFLFFLIPSTIIAIPGVILLICAETLFDFKRNIFRTGKIIAVITIIYFIMMVFVGNFTCPDVSGFSIYLLIMIVVFIIPFAVIFFAIGAIKRILFLAGSVFLCIYFLGKLDILTCHSVEVSYVMAAIICNGVACGLAMIFPFWS